MRLIDLWVYMASEGLYRAKFVLQGRCQDQIILLPFLSFLFEIQLDRDSSLLKI